MVYDCTEGEPLMSARCDLISKSALSSMVSWGTKRGGGGQRAKIVPVARCTSVLLVFRLYNSVVIIGFQRLSLMSTT